MSLTDYNCIHFTLTYVIRSGDCGINFETCSKLEEHNLDMIKDSDDTEDESEFGDALSARCVMFRMSWFMKLSFPQLTNQSYSVSLKHALRSVNMANYFGLLSTLLSEIGLNIREAHVFSTTDGYSLDVFVVDGWSEEVDFY
ncbi:hypothetical protein BHM03_00001563 [Ensete ventricosum]|nr:hypothetical protein BHM03_00001563 [Ensete ventricosum]